MKVDLAYLKELDRKSKELMDEYLRIRGEIVDEIPFCDKCGDKDPVGGFYPLGIFGSNSISGLICNPCRRKK